MAQESMELIFTTEQLAALNYELQLRNASRPGNHIPTVRDLVFELANDLIRKQAPKVNLLKIIQEFAAQSTTEEFIARMAKAGFEPTIIAGT